MVYTTVGFWVLLAGVILIIVSSFAEIPIPVDAFKFGVGLAFAAFLAPGPRP